MGVEYALVCDKTKEAYDLGKGPWYRWWPVSKGVPGSEEEVRSFLCEHFEDDWLIDKPVTYEESRKCEAWRRRLASAIWGFISTHPNCHIVDDCGDDYWGHPDTLLDKIIIESAGGRLFKEVGCRYDVKLEEP